MSRRIEIIGGGPGGLYAARLMKLADPAADVVVHERLDAGRQTFGFGVGLTESTMTNLRAADAETAERVREASYAGHNLELRTDVGTATLHGARNLAIGRATLLKILADAARAVGVDYRPGSKADVANITADVVVAADGVRSATREKLSAELAVHTSTGRVRFVWCGADFAVDSAFFSSVSTEQGLFVVHAYPYATDRSTFLIEADEQTWQTAGLDKFDAATPPGETDVDSVKLLEEVFAEQLKGRALLTNRTRWGRFTTLSLDRWSTGNTVLLGDAAHTAHYTLGSGTKLALEDAIALASALAGDDSVEAAFASYEQTRRPTVERFKRLAGRSQGWWDSYRMRAGWDAERIALSYMTRSGNLTIADYAREQLPVVRAALAWLGSDVPSEVDALDEWVLRQPMNDPHCLLPRRCLTVGALNAAAATVRVVWSEPDPLGEPADALVDRSGTWAEVPLVLDGDDDPEHVGARIDLSERIRLQTDRVVGVALPAEARAQGAAAIATGRTDFVVID